MRRFLRTRDRGATLLELIISNVLILLVLTAIYALMRSGSDYLYRSDAKMDLHRSSIIGMHKLSREVGLTNANTVRADTNALLFASPMDDNGYITTDQYSRKQWYRFVLFYIDQNAQGVPYLARKEKALATPTTEAPAPEAHGISIAGLKGDASVQPSVASLGVSSLTVSVSSSSVDMRLEAVADSRGEYRLEVSDKVVFKN